MNHNTHTQPRGANNKLKLISHTVSKATEHTYTIDTGEEVLFYKEWIESNGRAIDSILRDRDGNEIVNHSLLTRIENLIYGED